MVVRGMAMDVGMLTGVDRDPKRLCHFLLEQGLEHGVKLHHPAKAISVTKNSEGVLTGIKIERDNGEVFDSEHRCLHQIICAFALEADGNFASPLLSTRSNVRRLDTSSILYAFSNFTDQHPDIAAGRPFAGCALASVDR